MKSEHKTNLKNNFHTLSFRDPNGRVMKLDGQIYRAITANQASFYRELFQKGIIHQLVEKKLLIKTEISPLTIEGYELILKHRTISYVSYAHEWCDRMLKDAALLHIDLLIELNQYGLTSQDGVHLNILFDGSEPIFVDFCSIVMADQKVYWPGIAYQLFRNNFIFPLSLMSRGYTHMARSWIKNSYYVDSAILKTEIELFNHPSPEKAKLKRATHHLLNRIKQLIPLGMKPQAKQFFNSIKRNGLPTNTQSRLSFLDALRKEVEAIHLPDHKIDPSRCYDNFFASLRISPEWTTKQKKVHQVLLELKPNSVLDLDGNHGWYAQLAATCGSQVVALDTEEACVRKIYTDARQKNLPILPLVMDWTAANFNLTNDFFGPVHERIGSDLVLGLNFVHHVIFNPYLGLERLLERMFCLSKRWVLVEFIPAQEILNLIPLSYMGTRQFWEQSDWYQLDEFIQLFQSKFKEIEQYRSHPDTRTLILFEKRAGADDL